MTEPLSPTDESPSGWPIARLELAVSLVVTATVVCLRCPFALLAQIALIHSILRCQSTISEIIVSGEPS